MLTRSELAAHIAVIADLWTIIEEEWGSLLAEMLHAEAKIGVTMYLSLNGTASQYAILTSVADARLFGQARRDEFGKLLADSRRLAGERNRVVHGRWGVLQSKSDRLILMARDWFPRAEAALKAVYINPDLIPWAEMPPLEEFTYTAKDFGAIEKRLNAFRLRLFDFIKEVAKDRKDAEGLAALSRLPRSET